MYYVFDVDGTLTPSRGTMDPEFAAWFKEFAKKHIVCYVTGSDRDKTVEQIGEELFNLADYSFNCAGNEVWMQGKRTFTSLWKLPEDAHDWLSVQLTESTYPKRLGLHFEHRKGLVNFSVVGRNARGQDRIDYYEWDKQHQERVRICTEFNHRFPTLQAQVGGETGIDIFAKGSDKSQVISYLRAPIRFYGDSMGPTGNDRPLADAILDKQLGECYTVIDWRQTWELLKNA